MAKGSLCQSWGRKNKYLDSYFVLKDPNIDNITERLNQIGPAAILYKVDISRAFRHVRIDPGDVDLLALQHKGLYLDENLPLSFHTYINELFAQVINIKTVDMMPNGVEQ